jgi:cyclopropane-fatty-acyl-phospholipid synthase
MIEKAASDMLFRRLDTIDSGQITVVTPDGKTRVFAGRKPGEKAKIELKDWRVIPNMIRKGDVGFAEDYRAGLWDTDNLVALTMLGLVNRSAMDHLIVGSQISRTITSLSYLLRLNTLNGSRKNIHAHYDLGNEFYSLWLDPSMTYSSALFQDEKESLQQAQNNKYDRIIDCIGAQSGSLLEIGCGWGGFAERAVERGDFALKGITLSQEQHDYAQHRLKDKAKIALEDYRHQEGKFDHIVSIEMFEAVGERYWKTYFDTVGSLLNRGGKAVIQTITMNEQDFPRYRRGGDFIRSYIFPGGMLPSPSRFKEEASKAGLLTNNEFFFGQDYARTLEHWLEAFDNKYTQVKAQGFDDGFIRLWRFYLAACIAGFKTGRTNVMQVELTHA